MNYIGQITIVKTLNGKSTYEVLREEFNEGTSVENRRNAIKYLQDLEVYFELAEFVGVNYYTTRDEVDDMKNFNALVKSLTCVHSRGTVELINKRFMDDFDHTAATIDALLDEFHGFCQEVINTDVPAEAATVVFETNGIELHAFADDLDWIFEVNGCDVEL